MDIESMSEEERKYIVNVDAACLSNYQDYVCLVKYYPDREHSEYSKVFLGKKDNYDNIGHYDNKDGSLIYLSNNKHIYSFLTCIGWVMSQAELIKYRGMKDEDFREFQELKDTVLKPLTEVVDMKFGVDIFVSNSGQSFTYPDYDKSKSATPSVISSLYKKAQKDYEGSVVILNVDRVSQIRGDIVDEIKDDLDLTPEIYKERDKEVKILYFNTEELESVLDKIRQKHSVAYVEVDGDATYIPSIYEEDLTFNKIDINEVTQRSRETLKIVKQRMLEWMVKKGTNDKLGKERIIKLTQNPTFDIADLGEAIYREYGDGVMYFKHRAIKTTPDYLQLQIEDAKDPTHHNRIDYPWQDVAREIKKEIENGTYLSVAENIEMENRTPKEIEDDLEKRAKKEIFLGYRDANDLNNALEKMTFDEIAKLLGQEPRDFQKEVQDFIEDEYKDYMEYVYRQDKKAIFEMSLQNNFYNELYDILMLPKDKTPLSSSDFRGLYDDTPKVMRNLYEYYLAREKQPIADGESIVRLIKDYNLRYHDIYIKLAKEFDVLEMRQVNPDRYKDIPVYMKSLDYAKKNKEEKDFYRSNEISYKCMKDIDKELRTQRNENFLLDIVDKYGVERVKVTLALAIKNMTKSQKDQLRFDTLTWVNEYKTPNKSAKKQVISTSSPLAIELVLTEVRLRYEENKKMDETKQRKQAPKLKTFYINTSKKALIKKYDMHSYMQMPKTGKYSGYTYSLFNARVKDDPNNPNDIVIRLEEDETVQIKNKNGDLVKLNVEEFTKEVEKVDEANYVSSRETFSLEMPKEALTVEYEGSYRFDMPLNSTYSGKSYFLPKSFITLKKDGSFKAQIPSDYSVSLKGEKGEENVEISAEEFSQIIANHDTYKQKGENEEAWLYMFVPLEARLGTYENSSMFKAPLNGKYKGYIYYIPNKMLKENLDKGQIRIALPKSFEVNLRQSELNKQESILAKELMEELKNKEYNNDLSKPSEYAKGRFKELEQSLRDNIPKEMKDRNNWVAVRTRFNEENNRYSKYLINVHTGKFAESDNSETWASFEEACNYARENNADTIAYALDGEDKIFCIDLDGCLNEDGEFNDIAKEVHKHAKGLYMEKSISGKGLHFFGKTEYMPLRSFSRDGDLEFYQKSHFMAMTGDTELPGKLKDIKGTSLEEFLASKCDTRSKWKGQAEGLSGLSYMSDREVVDRASSAMGGETFERLYNGEDLQHNHSNSDMSLMNRLAFWCNGDKEQMLRIFATSGLYRKNKSPDYYESTAIKAIMENGSRYVASKAKDFVKNRENEKNKVLDSDLDIKLER